MKMYLFYLLLVSVSVHIITTSDLNWYEERNVKENDNITLHCDIRGHEDVAWYRLRSSSLTLLISAQKTRTIKSLPVYYNYDEKRFILRPNSEITTAMFTILKLSQGDLGFYYCGITAEPAQMHFGKATKLQFQDKIEATTVTQTTPSGDQVKLEDKWNM
ncbi:hypothetical protein HF521_001879 [Silurus meridionalis]|uniref:Immunoglobulin domain-containing protein n=1 Tax=Silurus meridionalis TaxID=175797 RepID=A0A8T0B7D5_SILME|nr:hypothetical protein HF521_001879 [Silurus meridionalis]